MASRSVGHVSSHPAQTSVRPAVRPRRPVASYRVSSRARPSGTSPASARAARSPPAPSRPPVDQSAPRGSRSTTAWLPDRRYLAMRSLCPRRPSRSSARTLGRRAAPAAPTRRDRRHSHPRNAAGACAGLAACVPCPAPGTSPRWERFQKAARARLRPIEEGRHTSCARSNARAREARVARPSLTDTWSSVATTTAGRAAGLDSDPPRAG